MRASKTAATHTGGSERQGQWTRGGDQPLIQSQPLPASIILDGHIISLSLFSFSAKWDSPSASLSGQLKIKMNSRQRNGWMGDPNYSHEYGVYCMPACLSPLDA